MATLRSGAVTLAGVVLALVLAIFYPGTSAAGSSCVPLSPAQLFLDPDYELPLTDPDAVVVQMPNYGTLSLPPRGGAVITLQVLPPQMTNPEDAFISGTDYSGCIDAESGAGQLDFQRAGPYIVRMGYADGHVDHLEVHVISVPAVIRSPALRGTGGRGYSQITSVPDGAQGYRDRDFAGEPSGHSAQATLDNLISQIRSDQLSAGQPIDIALRFHGSSGQIKIGNDWMGLGPKGKANLDKFCNGIKGKVKSVTLLSCKTGKGKKGCDFIKAMSSCLGGTSVNAMTGRVTSTWRKGPGGVAIPSTIKFVQNGQQTSSGGCN